MERTKALSLSLRPALSIHSLNQPESLRPSEMGAHRPVIPNLAASPGSVTDCRFFIPEVSTLTSSLPQFSRALVLRFSTTHLSLRFRNEWCPP